VVSKRDLSRLGGGIVVCKHDLGGLEGGIASRRDAGGLGRGIASRRDAGGLERGIVASRRDLSRAGRGIEGFGHVYAIARFLERTLGSNCYKAFCLVLLLA
jgi:hypothetical protein